MELMVGIVMQNKDRGGVMLKMFHSVSGFSFPKLGHPNVIDK